LDKAANLVVVATCRDGSELDFLLNVEGHDTGRLLEDTRADSSKTMPTFATSSPYSAASTTQILFRVRSYLMSPRWRLTGSPSRGRLALGPQGDEP
jgi:hypothetical protein